MYSHSVPAPRILSLGWLIILAILINLLLLCLIFYFETENNAFSIEREQEYFPLEIAMEEPPEETTEESAADQEDMPPPLLDEVAALKPRASVFGATDEVDDLPEFTPGTTDSLSTCQDGSGLQQELPQATAQPPEKNRESSVEQQEAINEPSEDISDGSDDTKLEGSISPIETYAQGIAAPLEQKQQARAAKRTPDPEQTQREKPLAPPLPQQQIQQRRPTRNNTGQGKRNVSPIDRSKQLSFKDLAQGFLESIKNEGQDWMERKGNESIRPNPNELRYHCYLQKVYWQLQSICKQAQIPGNPRWDTNMRLGLEFIINRNGEITAVNVIEPTGHLDADELGVGLIRKAGPFAPIPQHIPHDQIPLTFYIIFNSTQSRVLFSYS